MGSEMCIRDRYVTFSDNVCVKLSPSRKFIVAAFEEDVIAVELPTVPPGNVVTLFASAPNILPVAEGNVRVTFPL